MELVKDEAKPLQIQPTTWLDDAIVEPKTQATNGEKTQFLRCENTTCKDPEWSRPSVRGKSPKLCPPCKAAKEAAEAAAAAAEPKEKIQVFKCQNPDCIEPEWTRTGDGRGKASDFCPPCREDRNAAKAAAAKAAKNAEPEKIQTLVCQNEECKKEWTRTARFGYPPKFCMECQEAKGEPEPVESEEKVQHLRCENVDCEKPEWTRPSARGKKPKLCTVCRNALLGTQDDDVEEEDEEGTNPARYDAPVFSSLSKEQVNNALTALQSF